MSNFYPNPYSENGDIMGPPIINVGRVGTSSNSNGQFWYGSQTNFPGFLYKRNVGVGGRRSTKFNPGGNTFCNKSRYLYYKYKPGTGGVGASSISNRRAKNRMASVCTGENGHCGAFYQYLGRYTDYGPGVNPNGYFVYPQQPGTQTGVHIQPSRYDPLL